MSAVSSGHQLFAMFTCHMQFVHQGQKNCRLRNLYPTTAENGRLYSLAGIRDMTMADVRESSNFELIFFSCKLFY